MIEQGLPSGFLPGSCKLNQVMQLRVGRLWPHKTLPSWKESLESPHRNEYSRVCRWLLGCATVGSKRGQNTFLRNLWPFSVPTVAKQGNLNDTHFCRRASVMSQEPPPNFNFDTSGGKGHSASDHPKAQSGAKKLLSSLSATAGAAAKLVARQTERTKLTTMTLPAAYRALGKDCVQQHRHLDCVPELVQQLRSVMGDLKMLSEAVKGQPDAQSLTDKAKAAGWRGW
jgi:hypothetical protein